MEPELGYYSPKNKNSCQFTVKGSRFIGTLAPVSSESHAIEIITAATDDSPDATHHAYAYRINAGKNLLERLSDDHEPAGSAGIPMLQILQGKNVSDALVIGTRYYGGIKLGIGGLIRAYRDCARQSLSTAVLIRKEPLCEYLLKFDYKDLGAVTRLLESFKGKVIKADYGDMVVIKIVIAERYGEIMIAGYISTCRGHGKWSLLERA